MATPLPVIDARFTLAEVASATEGTLTGDPSVVVRGLGTDTRAMQPGALFVALAGERFDGHHHLDAAVARGASAVLVRRGAAVPDGVAQVEVDDTLRALGDLARFHARRVRAVTGLPVVAIGGAVGKTTTKELTAAAMGAAFGPTLATAGNLNNLVGAPLTLLTLDRTHRAAVVECGTNAVGEIARLGAVIEPDVAMVMNADAAHTEGLGSIEGVAREEGSLFGFARRAVVGNADEALSAAEMCRAGPGVARWLFGADPRADARVVARVVLPDGRARVSVAIAEGLCPGAGTLTVETALVGPAVATNLAAALCATAAAGADADGLRAAAMAMGQVPAVSGRLNVLDMPWPGGTIRVLDDTYNSSPRALRAALDAAQELAHHTGARLVVALGDMLELGALADEEHARAGSLVAAAGAEVFVAVGAAMARAMESLRLDPRPVLRPVRFLPHCTDAVDAGRALRALVRAGDLVLVKGSRGMQMERCLDALREGA